MENLIEAIRAALRDDADHAARDAGLVACRKILATLEAATDDEAPPAGAAAPSSSSVPGTETAPAPAMPPPATEPTPGPPPAPALPIDPATVATLFASLGKLPPEQLLDLAIARLRAALPPGVSVPAPAPLRFQLVPLHHLERSK
jgi:hypothetical protein